MVLQKYKIDVILNLVFTIFGQFLEIIIVYTLILIKCLNHHSLYIFQTHWHCNKVKLIDN